MSEKIDMTDPYNIVFHALMELGLQNKVANSEISQNDFILAFADFFVINCIAMNDDRGLQEETAIHAIQRMKKTLQDWKEGNHPFENFNGSNNLN